jgi:hypothetical protein
MNIFNFYGFWDSNKVIDNIQLTQIKLWANSILFFHKNVKVYLYTKKTIIPNKDININNLEIIYLDNFEDLFTNTPLNNYKIPSNLSKPELSDIIRLVLLYKNGGTWLDIDDIVVRKFPEKKNIIGTFLWKNNKKQAYYWGSTFNLVEGSCVSDKYKNFGFHIQNDPMINWEKGNKFLFKWMENIQKYKSSDWGQKIPTELIRINTSIINDCNVTLLPQHHLLLHPAFGSNKQFGYPNSKGPMFPPYDLRITGKVNYDDMISKGEFWDVMKQTLEKHDYCCVKNSKNTGIIQCNQNKDKRWFIGHLCDLNNIENILGKIKTINDLNIIFNYKGLIKYGNIGDDIFYPLSIILCKMVIENKYKIKLNNIIQNKNIVGNKIINITGGGTLIHAIQTNFTKFIKNDNNYLLLGTGMTDVKLSSVNSSNVNDFIKNMNLYTFKNENIKSNLNILKYFQDNNRLFGGFRGLYEKFICHKNGYKFNYINDLGLLSEFLLEEPEIIKSIFNIKDEYIPIKCERKIILLNTCHIFGIDAFKDDKINYDKYNKNITDIFIKFGVFLIKQGYSVIIMPFHPSSKQELNITEDLYKSIKSGIEFSENKFLMKITKYNILSGLNLLKQIHIAIGIRLHCNIICNGFLIPTINIAYGVKGVNYSVTNDLSKYLVPTFSKYLTFDKLKGLFFDIENNYDKIKIQLEQNKNNTENMIFSEIKMLFSNYNLEKYSNFNIVLNKLDKGTNAKFDFCFY